MFQFQLGEKKLLKHNFTVTETSKPKIFHIIILNGMYFSFYKIDSNKHKKTTFFSLN